MIVMLPFVKALLAGSISVNLTNGVNGKVYRVFILNNATGGYTVTWINSVNWRDNTTPVQTTTLSRGDFYTFLFSGGKIYGDQAANFSNS